MRNLWLQIGVIVAFLAVAVRAQSPRPTRRPVVSTSSVTSASSFAAAATTNVSLRNDLTWTFGGKQQRGWYLYDLLIGKTLNTTHEPTTSDFAAAVASWQKKHRTTADGILDQDALMAMVSRSEEHTSELQSPDHLVC